MDKEDNFAGKMMYLGDFLGRNVSFVPVDEQSERRSINSNHPREIVKKVFDTLMKNYGVAPDENFYINGVGPYHFTKDYKFVDRTGAESFDFVNLIGTRSGIEKRVRISKKEIEDILGYKVDIVDE